MPELPRFVWVASGDFSSSLERLEAAIRTYHQSCTELESAVELYGRANRQSGAMRHVVRATQIEEYRARGLAMFDRATHAFRDVETALTALESALRGATHTRTDQLGDLCSLRISLDAGRIRLAEIRAQLLASSADDGEVLPVTTEGTGVIPPRRRRRARGRD